MRSHDRLPDHLPQGLPDGPVHLLIHGRVQGVGFRETLVFEANRLGARGWVRNRLDGTVETVLDGPPHVRAALFEWARSGPPAARVTHVDARGASSAEAAALGPRFTRLPTAS
jgi:acylphosphatase